MSYRIPRVEIQKWSDLGRTLATIGDCHDAAVHKGFVKGNTKELVWELQQIQHNVTKALELLLTITSK